MADVQVTGSFVLSSLGTSFVDDYVCHAKREICFWEDAGAAYEVEITIDDQTAAPLTIAASANPYQILVAPGKEVVLQFKAAAGTVTINGYAS